MSIPSLQTLLNEAYSRYRNKRAIISYRSGLPEAELNYETLNRDTNQLANFFCGYGIEKGDLIVLFLPKSLIFVTAYLAFQKLGAIPVPLNPGFKMTEMAYFIEDTKAKLVLAGSDQAETIKRINPKQPLFVIDTDCPYHELDFFRGTNDNPPLVEMRPDDPGIIIYTSGTTGKPKGAVLTQRNLAHDANKIVNAWEISEKDVLCHVLPLFHIHGLGFALHTSLIAGASILLMNDFHPGHIISLLSNRRKEPICTIFMGVPAIYTKLIGFLDSQDIDFSHMRLWACGSAPMPPRDFEKIKKTFGKEPVEREGMTETGMNFSNPLKGIKKPGSIGLPLPGLKVKIAYPGTLEDVSPGETGEILLKGPGIIPGYWEKPEETAKAFCDGWFRTGDLGHIDSDGYFFLTDRIKHIIISGGENISPKEIESVINRMEGVIESSVVGISDEKWGEMVAAAVVLKSGAKLTTEDIQSTCKEHLHDWKCPKKIAFLDHLPKNTMGKILKEEVKKIFD